MPAVRKPPSGGWTYEHYLLLPGGVGRWQVLSGERFVSPPPNTGHQRVVLRLTMSLARFVEERGGGTVLQAPLDVVLSERDVVVPELCFVSDDRAGLVRERGVFGAPDFVAEVVSEASRRTDEVLKPVLYESRAVLEYWVVDPVLETVKVRRRENGAFGCVEVRGAGSVVRSNVLPGWEVEVQELFA